MVKLSQTQQLMLEGAASRPRGALLPPPDGINLKGGALKATLVSLVRRGLVTERGRTKTPVITKAGRDFLRSGGRGDALKRHGPSRREQVGGGNRAETKRARVLTALRRSQGACIAELMEITGWQSHSVRAALTGLRKREIAVARTKNEAGASIYRAGPV